MYVRAYVHTHTYICTDSTYVRTHIHTEGGTFIRMYAHTHVRKTEKLYALGIIRCGGIKSALFGAMDNLLKFQHTFLKRSKSVSIHIYMYVVPNVIPSLKPYWSQILDLTYLVKFKSINSAYSKLDFPVGKFLTKIKCRNEYCFLIWSCVAQSTLIRSHRACQ